MCFSIPYKVLRVKDDIAWIENGNTVKIGNDLHVQKGEYLRIIGNVAVGKLSQKEGLEIRQLIKELNN